MPSSDAKQVATRCLTQARLPSALAARRTHRRLPRDRPRKPEVLREDVTGADMAPRGAGAAPRPDPRCISFLLPHPAVRDQECLGPPSSEAGRCRCLKRRSLNKSSRDG